MPLCLELHLDYDCTLDMPFCTYIGCTNRVSRGSCLANINEPKTQNMPLIINVSGAPILLASQPENKLPKGTIPINAML